MDNFLREFLNLNIGGVFKFKKVKTSFLYYFEFKVSYPQESLIHDRWRRLYFLNSKLMVFVEVF